MKGSAESFAIDSPLALARPQEDPPDAGALPALCSLEKLKEQAGEGKIRGLRDRACFMHLETHLPEARTMPVLTVQWGEALLPPESPPGDMDVSEPYGFGFEWNSPLPDFSHADCERVPLSLSRDRNAAPIGRRALTLGEAVTFVIGKVEAHSPAGMRITTDELAAVCRRRRVRARGGYPAQGYYELHFRQLLLGVPVLGSIASMLHHSVREKGGGFPMPVAYVASPEAYWIGTGYMVVKRVAYPDVPLCELSFLLEKWEALASSGLVAGIESIRLGYVLYLGWERVPEVWAVPTWVMRCAYAREWKEGRAGLLDAEPPPDAVIQRGELFFHAQTGEMIPPCGHSPNGARHAPIITWEQAGEAVRYQ